MGDKDISRREAPREKNIFESLCSSDEVSAFFPQNPLLVTSEVTSTGYFLSNQASYLFLAISQNGHHFLSNLH